MGAGLAAALLFAASLAAQKTEARPHLDVPYVPSTEEAVNAMLKLAKVTSSDVVYDLGCGDGRIVVAAAKNFGAHGVGIDIDPVRIAEANANAKKAGVQDRVKFINQDLFKANFHEATVVTLFLLSSINLKLKPVLMQQLKPGTRIVSNTFDMGDWKAESESTVDGNGPDEDYDMGLSRKFFLWTVPTKK
jgi:SAM-dependent methyltransferase